MKLTLKKKLTGTHVCGGRVLRVVLPHAVPTSSLSRESNISPNIADGKKPPPRFAPGTESVMCQLGDLVVEVVRVKDKKVIGYSYLSGPAIQLIRYRLGETVHDTKTEWFESGKATLIDISPANNPEDPAPKIADAHWKQGNDVVAFFCRVPSKEAAMEGQEWLTGVFGMVPKDLTDEQANEQDRCHVLGIFRWSGMLLVHFQPHRHATSWAADLFQVALVLEGLGLSLANIS